TRMADRLSEAISRGRRITSDVLRFSHPPEPVIKRFDVLKWLACCFPELESIAAGRGVRLHFEIPDTEPAASGDPALLRDALTQLVTNAWDAMAMGGDLTIVLSDPERDGRIGVRDTGSGMPPKTLEQIFEPLF